MSSDSVSVEMVSPSVEQKPRSRNAASSSVVGSVGRVVPSGANQASDGVPSRPAIPASTLLASTAIIISFREDYSESLFRMSRQNDGSTYLPKEPNLDPSWYSRHRPPHR